MSRRIEKVSDLIMKELGKAIQIGLSDPRIGFVTISEVKLSADLAFADVFVSVMGSEKDEISSLEGLKSSSSFLRTHLSKNLSTRTVPKLKFILDKGQEQSTRIQQILSELDDDLK